MAVGYALLAIGALGCICVAWVAVRQNAARRHVFVATAYGTNDYGTSLQVRDPQGVELTLEDDWSDQRVAINPGDTIPVRPRPGLSRTATEFRPAQGLVVGAVVSAWFLFCGIVAVSTANPPLSGKSLAQAVISGLFACCGVLPSGRVTEILRGLPGSTRVNGVVTDVHLVDTSKKSTYQALVQYLQDGRERVVWSPPRWTEPRLGGYGSVRLAGQNPHRALMTNGFGLFSIVVCEALGVIGLLGALALAV